MCINNFRVSDSDFATYLTILGYKIKNIEVKQDKKHNNKLKAFIYFEGEKIELVKLQNDYINDKKVEISLKEFSINRQKVNKLIKKKLNNYQKVV
jgi:hypothetical protein